MKFYIATIFLLHGLSPVAGLAFGFFVAFGYFIFTLVSNVSWARAMCFRKDDKIFGVIYVLGTVPLLVQPGNIGIQNFTYLCLWLGVWTVCYWWVREWGLKTKIAFTEVSQAATIGCMVLGISILLEFVLANSVGLYISDFIPFSIDVFPAANVLGDELNRPRGFASEAGFTAIAFECLIPLAIYDIFKSRAKTLVFFLIVVPAYFVLFSAASIILLVLTFFIYIWTFHGYGRAFFTVTVFGAIVAVAIMLSSLASELFNEIIGRKFLEFSVLSSDQIGDSFSRVEAYVLAFKVMAASPFGVGWGTVSQYASTNTELFGTELKGTGLISIPLEIGAAAGWLGLILFLAIVFNKLSGLVRVHSTEARLIFFSLLWVALHHTVVFEMWFPMLWLTLALSDIFSGDANVAEGFVPPAGVRQTETVRPIT